MARRNKLMKFSDLVSFPNVYENYNPKDPKLVGIGLEEKNLKGSWTKLHFQNDYPLVLELACGRGEYSLGLAEMYPYKNFIGIDIKGARIWKGATIAIEQKLDNVAFLRTRIEQIDLFFGENEVDEIWITFPDPFLKSSKENRRLTAPSFLDRYRKFLKANGTINLKTDSPELYAFTKEVLGADESVEVIYDKDDIYIEALEYPELELKTYYEKMHLEDKRKIKFIKFKFI